MDDMVERLKAFLESEDGKESSRKFAEKMLFKRELKKKHIEKIKKMFHDQETFNILVNKILNRHDDAYVDKCYKNGYMPHPMNLLYSLFDLANIEGVELTESLDDLTENWPSEIHEYMDWQFAVTHGQGSVCSVYYKKELMYRD